MYVSDDARNLYCVTLRVGNLDALDGYQSRKGGLL